jgi:NAD(P)-dependent dehydrogenase (short-subunit alcohol dehydrogenase family)
MAKEPRSLYGKVVVITGGGRGIGKATAQALVRHGARVGIGDLDGDLARKTAAELGGGVVGLDLNVVDKASFAAFLDSVEEQIGPIDVLINNAGIMPLSKIDEEDDATTQRIIDVNLIGVLNGVKLAIPRLRSRRSGHIVNVASLAGKAGNSHAVTYCATKFGVVGISESLRSELREDGIDVSVVMPAAVNTDLALGLADMRGGFEVEPEEVADEIVEALRLNRFDVPVPRKAGRIMRVMAMLPRPAAEAIGRFLKGDRVLADADMSARKAYEERTKEADPGVEERVATGPATEKAPAS